MVNLTGNGTTYCAMLLNWGAQKGFCQLILGCVSSFICVCICSNFQSGCQSCFLVEWEVVLALPESWWKMGKGGEGEGGEKWPCLRAAGDTAVLPLHYERSQGWSRGGNPESPRIVNASLSLPFSFHRLNCSCQLVASFRCFSKRMHDLILRSKRIF